jgi:hypothetical protein
VFPTPGQDYRLDRTMQQEWLAAQRLEVENLKFAFAVGIIFGVAPIEPWSNAG